MKSYESFKIIEDFIQQIPDCSTKDRFEEIILRRKPFQQFKNLLVDHPELRQQWFIYKDQQYRDYVKEQIETYDLGNNDSE